MATLTRFDLNAGRSGVNEARTYTEDTPYTDLAPVAVVTATGNFSGQTLRISGLTAETRIGFDGFATISGANVRISGVTIGTIVGGTNGTDLVITFNSNANAAGVQTLMQELTYTNTSETPLPVQDIVFNLAGSVRTTTVTNITVNDLPLVDLNGAGSGANNTASFIEQTPVTIAPAAVLSDPDSANFVSLTANLTARPNGNASELLALNSSAANLAAAQGMAVAYNSATGTLSIAGSASQATYQAILRGIVYNNTSDNPSTANRTIQVVTNDGQGSSLVREATISVVRVNDAPVLDLNGNDLGSNTTISYRGNDPLTKIAPAGTVLDIDSVNFNGGSLRVEFTQNGAATDQLRIATDGIVTLGSNGATVSVNGTAIGTVSGGGNGSALVISFNSNNSTPSNVQALLEHIGYVSTSASPSGLARQVAFTLNDGDGVANGGQAIGTASATISMTTTNVAPIITGDLQATLSGSTSYQITSADLFFTDPDDAASGVTFTASQMVNGIILVNGAAATSFSGQQLADGAVSFQFSTPNVTAASFMVSVEDGNEDASVPVARTFQFVSNQQGESLSFATSGESVSVDLGAGVWRDALKIMPFGDSITNGDAPDGMDEHGYRGFLWEKLAGRGILVDFVGPNNNGLVPDGDHAGFPGWTADDLEPLLPGLLAAYSLDAILMMAGTNDVFWEARAQDTVGLEIKAMLDYVAQVSPATQVYVSTLIPFAGSTAEVDAVNVAIRATVAAAISQDQNVVQAEMMNITLADLWDGIHPTDAGYLKMAENWLTAILSSPPDSDPSGSIAASVTTVEGSSFNDLLKGDGRSNTLLGGGGNDWLEGGSGDDTLLGGAGRDTLIGGQGTDVLTGGADADTYVFMQGFGHDTITDFQPGQDRIDLRPLGLSVSNFGAWLASHATTSGSGTVVTIDAISSITLTGVASVSLHAGDFIFV